MIAQFIKKQFCSIWHKQILFFQLAFIQTLVVRKKTHHYKQITLIFYITCSIFSVQKKLYVADKRSPTYITYLNIFNNT